MNKRTIAATSALLVFPIIAAAGEAPRVDQAPTIDGVADDRAWRQAEWVELNHSILETSPAPEDFSGRYKVVWTPEYLYALAEITDDILIDSMPDPLKSYWNDDTLEFFIDEDASGGNHHVNDNAYAYHIALDNQTVDIGADGKPALYPNHILANWRRDASHPERIIWEVRIAVYAEGASEPRKLVANETLGFMVAYCDADSAQGREHFFGDVEIEPVNGDRKFGYIDATVFGKLTLTD